MFAPEKNPSYSTRRRHQREDHQWKQDMGFAQQADKIRWGIADKVRAEEERARSARDTLERKLDGEHGSELKYWMTLPIHQYEGGVKGSITVRHWKTPLPGSKDQFGPLLDMNATRMVSTLSSLREHSPGKLSGADGRLYEERFTTALAETQQRYPNLPKVVDNKFWLQLFRAAELTRDRNNDETHETPYGRFVTPVTVTHVPTLTGVTIAPEGLELVFAQRDGDAYEKWNTKTPLLRSAFRARGFDASNMEVKEDKDGSIRLVFEDAPSAFPKAICTPVPASVVTDLDDAVRRYSDAQWVLGVDARGREVSFPVEQYVHALIVGGTGGGKSVWSRSQMELLRTEGWTLYISDGKGSDAVAMTRLPNVGYVAPSQDISQIVWMIHHVYQEMQRRIAEGSRKKEAGDTRAYDYPPLLLWLDEWGTTSVALESTYPKKDVEVIFGWINSILRLGREPRVHIGLASQSIQKTGPGSVPGPWFSNLKLIVSLGNPVDTTRNVAFGENLRERAAILGPRIDGKSGRGMYGNVVSGRVDEFQSYYGWSPGTTSLDPDASSKVAPPTAEVRELWEQWVPVSASVPVLSPRFGIQAEDAHWRDSLESIIATPAIPLTDQTGQVIAGREQYDPRSSQWKGREIATASSTRAPLTGFSTATNVSADEKSTSTSAEPLVIPDDVRGTDDDPVYREAKKMGLVQDSDQQLVDDLHTAVQEARAEAKKRGLVTDDGPVSEPASEDMLDDLVSEPTSEPQELFDGDNEDPVKRKAREMGLLD